MSRFVLAVVVAVVGLTGSVRASTIHVPADHLTIQEAIDAAEPLDTIIVAADTYYENIFIWKPVILVGDGNPIIDGGNVLATVTFVGIEGPETLFTGFTVQNGLDIYGGGIAGNGTEATIAECTITFNTADVGGGIFGCDGLIRDCEISWNSAVDGGGVYRCDGTIRDCTISWNEAFGSGGGMYDCLATVQSSEIRDNTAGGNGGGFYSCQGDITGCTVDGNSAATYGGGFYRCQGDITDCVVEWNTARYGGGLWDCDGAIAYCKVSHNTADSTGYYGGGGLSGCDGTLSHCRITGNTSGYRGGGLWDCDGVINTCVISGNEAVGWEGGGGLYGCDGTISNCTIVGNLAGYGGGMSSCDGNISNCIVWFNKLLGGSFSQISGGSTPQYCNVQDGDDCPGCIIAHPLFVDSGSWSGDTWTEGDYHLRDVSPCRNAGDPDFVSDDTDIDGDARILEGRVDMGADEFAPTSGETLPDFDGDGLPDATDPDIDNDEVLNATDVCDYTPLGATVQSNGTLRADCDGDCDVDLADFRIMQMEYTG